MNHEEKGGVLNKVEESEGRGKKARQMNVCISFEPQTDRREGRR